MSDGKTQLTPDQRDQIVEYMARAVRARTNYAELPKGVSPHSVRAVEIENSHVWDLAMLLLKRLDLEYTEDVEGHDALMFHGEFVGEWSKAPRRARGERSKEEPVDVS